MNEIYTLHKSNIHPPTLCHPYTVSTVYLHSCVALRKKSGRLSYHWSYCQLQLLTPYLHLELWACQTKWPCEWMKQEDKAAFMAYACSRPLALSLRGSFRLLISHQGISAHLIPLGIYLSRREASIEAACVDGPSTFDQSPQLRLPICTSLGLRYHFHCHFQRDSGVMPNQTTGTTHVKRRFMTQAPPQPCRKRH